MISTHIRTVLALTVAGWLIGSATALAETITYKADLAAASVVPPTTSKATGAVTATYDTVSRELVWKGDYSGLSGPETAAHFHGPAAAGKNAGVAVPMAAAQSPFEGKATLSDAQAADLAAGMWYVNIHTGANPGGEIRGQVLKSN